MTIPNSLDNSFYMVVRKGVEFYYFGSGCIVDYYSDSIAYLDELDIEILLWCNNKKKEETQSIIKPISTDKKDILSRIDKLFKKGVLVWRKVLRDEDIVFHGTKGKYYPKTLAIELTDTCNYQCPFCYKNANANGKFISDKNITELNQLIHGNVNDILLTGGEPTLHPNYLKYIDIFSEYANVHMITNGSILYNQDAAVLRKLSLIQFSIYGCNDAEYKKMTGSADGFTRLCKSIEFAKQNEIYTKAAVTLCDATLDYIEEFVKLAANFGVDSLRIGIADVFGRGKYLYDGASDFVKKREEALSVITEIKRKYRNQMRIELPNINVKHVGNHDDMYQYINRNSLRCGCGSEYLVVSPTGEIRPCQMLPESWFSIKDKNALSEHIDGNFHINQLRKSVCKYYADNDFQQLNISPCQALESFVELENL